MRERVEGRKMEEKMFQNSRNEGEREARRGRKGKILVGRERKKRAESQEVEIRKGTRQISIWI